MGCIIGGNTMGLQFLIEVPATEKIKKKSRSTSKEAQSEFKKKDGQVTDDLLCNTRIHKGRKLVYFISEQTLEELETVIKDENLDWVILAANDGYQKDEKGNLILDDAGQKIINQLILYNRKEVMEFIKRKRVYGKNGDFVKEEAPTEIIFGKFQGNKFYFKARE